MYVAHPQHLVAGGGGLTHGHPRPPPCGHRQIVALLLMRGANLFFPSPDGRTPLEFAANEEIKAMIRERQRALAPLYAEQVRPSACVRVSHGGAPRRGAGACRRSMPPIAHCPWLTADPLFCEIF